MSSTYPGAPGPTSWTRCGWPRSPSGEGLRPSFLPPEPIRQLRDLTPLPRDSVRSRTAEKNRVEKLLEDACITLSVVVSDLFGVSGRDMMNQLISGQRDAVVLARLARTGMRKKIPVLQEALTGRFTDHHAFLLSTMLRRIDGINADIAELETQIEAVVAPFFGSGAPAR